MKKYNNWFNLVIVAIMGGLFTSCNDIFEDLSVNPNHLDVQGFYTNPESANKGVLGIYSYITTPRAMGA